MTSSQSRALALRLHGAQTDKAGRPYGEHLQAVVDILLRDYPDAPDDVVSAAWLHDAMEDTRATESSLRGAGVPETALDIIWLVTRNPAVTYLHWIRALAESDNQWAIRIKLADNEHNSDPGRALLDSDIIERRYRPARKVLLAALRGRPA